MKLGPIRSPLHRLSAAVLALIVAATVAGVFVTRSVVGEEQRRLLNDRADEAGLLVGTLFAPVTTALPSLPSTGLSRADGVALFRSQAQKDLGLTDAIGALQYSGGSYHSIASVGSGLAPGAPVGTDRATLAAKATTTKALVSAVVATPQGRRLSLSLAAGSGVVLYEDLIFDPSKPVNLNSAGVFTDLDGAVYATTHADSNSLVVATTTHLPLTGEVSRQTISVGPQQWLMVVKSHGPLVGPLRGAGPVGCARRWSARRRVGHPAGGNLGRRGMLHVGLSRMAPPRRSAKPRPPNAKPGRPLKQPTWPRASSCPA